MLYQDGNEIGQVGDYVPEWTLSIRNILHDEEARDGYRRHLLGTNSDSAVTMQAEGVDYIEFHGASMSTNKLPWVTDTVMFSTESITDW